METRPNMSSSSCTSSHEQFFFGSTRCRVTTTRARGTRRSAAAQKPAAGARTAVSAELRLPSRTVRLPALFALLAAPKSGLAELRAVRRGSPATQRRCSGRRVLGAAPLPGRARTLHELCARIFCRCCHRARWAGVVYAPVITSSSCDTQAKRAHVIGWQACRCSGVSRRQDVQLFPKAGKCAQACRRCGACAPDVDARSRGAAQNTKLRKERESDCRCEQLRAAI